MFTTFNRRRSLLAVAGFVLSVTFVLALVLAPPARAVTEQEHLVNEAQLTLEKLLGDENLGNMPDFLNRARAVYIIPALFKGGFVLGAEGGKGVLLAKGSDGSWSSPAFYTMAGGSIGLQIGGQVSQVVFTVMNDGAVEAVLNTQFKLGADLSVAVGPIGKGIEASTTVALGLDLYAFSKTAGLYGGGAFEGAAILKRDALNSEYYGATAGPRQIVIDRSVSNPQADKLRGALPD